MIELPAGLVGDAGSETVETALRRELQEETGYTCEGFKLLCEGPTSPGLSSEISSVYQAVGLTRLTCDDNDDIGPDGSVTHAAIRGVVEEGERIVVHEVPCDTILPWLNEAIKNGKSVDLRVYVGLAFVWRSIANASDDTIQAEPPGAPSQMEGQSPRPGDH